MYTTISVLGTIREFELENEVEIKISGNIGL